MFFFVMVYLFRYEVWFGLVVGFCWSFGCFEFVEGIYEEVIVGERR